jgi:hypothetical protein
MSYFDGKYPGKSYSSTNSTGLSDELLNQMRGGGSSSEETSNYVSSSPTCPFCRAATYRNYDSERFQCCLCHVEFSLERPFRMYVPCPAVRAAGFRVRQPS